MTTNPSPLPRAKAGLGWIAAIALGVFPLHLSAAGKAPDLDGDGIPNIVDPDIDGDGIPNALDDNIDGGIAKTGPHAGRYIGDHTNNDNPAEKDIDSDTLADDSLGETDIDGDSKSDNDPLELDADGDRRANNSPAEPDIDGDSRMDDADNEDDIDGDSLDDDDLMEDDIDGDHASDRSDSDIDGDNRTNSASDENDIDGDGRLNADDDEDDRDGDGTRNRDDEDDDNDDIPDDEDDDHVSEIDEQRIEQELEPTSAAPEDAEAEVSIRRMATGRTELRIKVEEGDPGTYQIVIGGTVRGTLVLSGRAGDASGEKRFKTGGTGDILPLDFAAAGQTLSLDLGGTAHFTGTIPKTPDAPPVDDNEPPTIRTAQTDLTRSAGVPDEAEAEVLVKIGLLGVIEIEIEVEDIPADTYDITIDGVMRGTLVVTGDDDDTEGHRHFEVIPDEPGEFLLDFPVIGRSIVISQDGTAWFTGTIPGGE